MIHAWKYVPYNAVKIIKKLYIIFSVAFSLNFSFETNTGYMRVLDNYVDTEQLSGAYLYTFRK